MMTHILDPTHLSMSSGSRISYKTVQALWKTSSRVLTEGQ